MRILSSGLLVRAQEAPRASFGTPTKSLPSATSAIGIVQTLTSSDPKGAKAVAERLMPRSALQKAIQVEVAAADLDEPGEALEGEAMVLWVGLLEKKYVSKLDFASTVGPTIDMVHVTDGGTKLVPHGPSLAEVAEDHFVFLSASSAAESQETLEKRMSKLEGSLAEIAALLKKPEERIQPELGASSKAPPQVRPSALRRGKPEVEAPRVQFEGLDPTVVSSALQAGVPSDQLNVLAGLLKKKSKMEDVDRSNLAKKTNILSESEDEDEPELLEVDGAVSQPNQMETALVKLTKIASSLTKGKKSRGSLLFLNYLIPFKGGSIQEAQDRFAGKSGTHFCHNRDGDGRGFFADEDRAKQHGQGDVHSIVDRTSLPAAELPKQCPLHVDSWRSPRRYEDAELGGGQSEGPPRNHCYGP